MVHIPLMKSHEGGFPFSEWTEDTDIADGLTDVGSKSAPCVFYMGSDWYLIAGESIGIFNGWKWSGSAWVTNSGIISGLTDVGINSAPYVFYMDSDWYLIAGEGSGVFNGWKWSGSAWVTNSGIVSGLTDVGNNSAPCVFYMDSDWYLIAGELNNDINGWKWSGSAWVTNSGIVDGLPTGYPDMPSDVSLDVFYVGDILYMIIGFNDEDGFVGWQWDGSSWTSNDDIVVGLIAYHDMVMPTIFYMDSDWYCIVGDSYGLFYGFKGI